MTTIQTDAPSSEASESWTRISGIAGIVYAGVFLVMGAGLAASAPAFTDGADELRTWFGENQAQIALFTWLAPVTSGVLFLIFAAGLRNRLATVDRSGGVLPLVSYGAAVAGFGFSIVGLAFWGVMTLDPVLEGASDGVLVTLSALDSVVFFVVAPWAQALFVAAASAVILRTRTMPVWLGALGCLVAFLLVISGLWIFDGDPTSGIGSLGLPAGLLGLIWIVITSVFMVRSPQH